MVKLTKTSAQFVQTPMLKEKRLIGATFAHNGFIKIAWRQPSTVSGGVPSIHVRRMLNWILTTSHCTIIIDFISYSYIIYYLIHTQYIVGFIHPTNVNFQQHLGFTRHLLSLLRLCWVSLLYILIQ